MLSSQERPNSRTSPQDNPRDLALGVLVRLEKAGVGSQEALSAALSSARTMTAPDRRLATELVYGCLRWKQYLDYTIHAASARGISKLNLHVRWALRIAAYQIGMLDRVPSHAAVNNGVRQVKAIAGRGLSGFANALLRKLSVQWDTLKPREGRGSKALSTLYSHPEWLVKKWGERWNSDELESICKAFTESAPVVLRVRKDSIADAKQWLNFEEGIAWDQGFTENSLRIQGGLDPRKSPFFEEGKWISQDEGSQWVVHAAGLQPGERVLDYCAGTGTKTTQIAEAVGPSGHVVAWDISDEKLRKLSELTKRWGYEVETSKRDGRQDTNSEVLFDAVIVDAPCTGLGTIRRRPEIKWRRSVVDLRRMQSDQLKLIRKASLQVRPGGTLVYAVCSTTLDECERVVETFLKECPERYARMSFPGETSEGEKSIDPRENRMDGFYVAKFKRIAS